VITSTPTFGRDVDDPDTDVADPAELLALWLPANTDALRPLMTLSTVDADGYPDARNVLLSLFDADGLHFHSGATSRKALQLRAVPRACATLVWPDIGRQVVVSGDVVAERAGLAAEVYAARGPYLRALAWANTDDLAQLPQVERRQWWARFATERPDCTLGAPPSWTGFVLAPRRYTFWRGDPDGPSNRIEYRSGPDGWTITRLAG
jgi:pyridoxamine 5'-phosphate oxidase